MEKSYIFVDGTKGMGTGATCLRVTELPGRQGIRVTVALAAGGDEMWADLTAVQWKDLCGLQYDLQVEVAAPEVAAPKESST